MKTIILTILLITPTLILKAEKENPIYDKLKDALLCKNDSLETIRGLEKEKKDLQKYGISFEKEGEEMDEVITIKLKTPLTIQGAKSKIIKADLNNGIIVYGEFSGNQKKLIQKLKLKKGKTIKGNVPVAKYVNPQTKENDCPNTIGLNPKGKNKFSLGCGWCNGG